MSSFCYVALFFTCFKCLAVASGIGIQCFLFGVIAGAKRARIFNKAFFEREFPDVHPSDRNVRVIAFRVHTETHVLQSGLPDMGNGKYSEKLSLEEWHECVFTITS